MPAIPRLTEQQAQELVLTTVATHAEALLRVAYRHSLCADDAHDAYQRSMEILLRRAPTLDPKSAHKWLTVVVKREAMEVRRTRGEAVASGDFDYDNVASDASSPEERAMSADHATRAAEALKRLKPQELRALWLKALGHSYEDSASNETRVRRNTPLLVDNSAPAAPVDIGSPQATSNTNNFSVAWLLPADSGAPITAARYQVCQAGSCGEVRAAPSTTRIDGLALPATGAVTVRVWLEDQLGHADPDSAATLALTYAAPPPSPPAPPAPRDEPQQAPGEQSLTPGLPGCLVSCGRPPAQGPPATQIKKVSPALKLTTLRRVGRRVTVAGTVGARASGRVTVRYRVRIRGRARTLTKRVAIARRAFRTTLMLSPAIAAARSATVSVAYSGDPDTVPQTRTATVRTRA